MTKNKKVIYSVSFLLPILVMLFAYLYIGVFINSSILINDLYTQYATFLSYFRNSILENGILYSFAKGMGGNFFGIFSYYLASPLNLLVFLFKSENIEIAISIIMLLRFGLSGLFFAWFISKQDKNFDISAAVFASLYALSSFIVILSYHILWADAFWLLPIIVVGQQKILQGQKPTVFITSFTALLLINYYMGYMVGLFCIIYFIYHTIAYGQKQDIIGSFCKMAGYAIVCIGLAMCMLLPSFYSLLQGKIAINSELVPEVGYRMFNIFSAIPKLFTGGYDSVGNISAPFLYCGGGVGVLVLGYFFLKNKSKREKLATAFFLVTFAFSLYFSVLYRAWHMFALPNSFPYRFSFIISFFLVFVAQQTFSHYRDIDYKKYLPVAVVVIAATAILGIWYPLHIRNVKIAVTTAVGLVAVAGMAVATKILKKQILYLLLAVFIFDISLNASILTSDNYNALGAIPRESYKQNYKKTKEALSRQDPEGFYRTGYTGKIDEPNISFKMGFNNYYYSFTSLPEVENENVKTNIIQSAKYPELAATVLNSRYTIWENTLTENDTGYFPLIYWGNKNGIALEGYKITVTGEDGKAEVVSDNTHLLSEYISALTGKDTVDAGGLNKENLSAASEYVTKNGIKSLYQRGNKIKGTLSAVDGESYGYTSIIYDEAWRIKVNGQKVKAQRVLESFIAFPVTKGENIIEMTYYPKGIFAGVAVTTATLLALAVIKIIKKKKSI